MAVTIDEVKKYLSRRIDKTLQESGDLIGTFSKNYIRSPEGKLFPKRVDFKDPQQKKAFAKDMMKGMAGATVAPKTIATRGIGGLFTGSRSIKPSTQEFTDDAIRFAKDLQKKVGGNRKYIAHVFDLKTIKPNDFDLANVQRPIVEAAKEEMKKGIFRPIVVSTDRGVLDGTHRLIAALELGIKNLPGVIERIL